MLCRLCVCTIYDRIYKVTKHPAKDINISNMDKCNLNLKKYTGTKVVEARPMNEIDAEYIGYARKNSDNHEWRDGYHVRYTNPDGSFYDSWSPKDVFEKAYREVKGMSFGEVIEALRAGLAVRRNGWNCKGLFVVKQVPSHITGDIIPKIQSLPQIAKDILMSREDPHIDYTNQMLIINPDGRADSWVPSSSDVFAVDWEVVTE